mgnify:CR=1 FL=1
MKITERLTNIEIQLLKQQTRNSEIKDLVVKYVENIDHWVRELNKKVTELSEYESLLVESADNTQHNYELIYELKDDMEELKHEINALKLIQIISLKIRKKEVQE